MPLRSWNLSRRGLLRAAVALPAAAQAPRAAREVTVGLIGAGNRGSFVAGLVAKHTPARITALCDVLPERMEDTRRGLGLENPALHRDFTRLLASNVDAVIIATPVYLHAEHFEAAVAAGKHIYIEKPAAVDVAGCKRIMRAADSADRRLHITFGFQRRYGTVYQKAHRLVASGMIGPLRLAAARFIKSEGAGVIEKRMPAPQSDADKNRLWQDWRHLSGDLIVENNVHSIDVMNWFVGAHPLSAIGAGGQTLSKTGDLRDHNFVAFEYPNAVQGQLSGTTLAPPGYRDVAEQFFGDRGMVETSENHWRHFRGRGQETVEKSPRDISIDAVADFVARIAESRPENNAIRGAESTLTAILGRMAMDTRREVTWDEMMRG